MAFYEVLLCGGGESGKKGRETEVPPTVIVDFGAGLGEDGWHVPVNLPFGLFVVFFGGGFAVGYF